MIDLALSWCFPAILYAGAREHHEPWVVRICAKHNSDRSPASSKPWDSALAHPWSEPRVAVDKLLYMYPCWGIINSFRLLQPYDFGNSQHTTVSRCTQPIYDGCTLWILMIYSKMENGWKWDLWILAVADPWKSLESGNFPLQLVWFWSGSPGSPVSRSTIRGKIDELVGDAKPAPAPGGLISKWVCQYGRPRKGNDDSSNFWAPRF